ncbi:MAG: hypothetical protein KY445_12240, partial [Armatimonadetes bacterium]|nr:hypothetical protein [Armatimonadota bacterium]
AKEKLDLTANLDSREIVFHTDGDYHPALKWVANDTLRVSFKDYVPQSQEISFQAVRLWNYKIEYRGLSAP